MKRPAAILVCVLVVMPLVAPRAAHADPVQVTSGFFGFSSGSGGSFRVRSDRFDLIATSFDDNDFGVPLRLCNPCTEGQLADVGGVLRLGEFFGSAELGGTSWPRVFLGGSITFSSPAVRLTDSIENSFSVPFTLAGDVQVFDGSHAEPGALLFASAIEGRGQASVFTMADGYRSVSLSITDEPAPVPEPATLFLFGTGAAALVQRARRRKKLAARGESNFPHGAGHDQFDRGRATPAR